MSASLPSPASPSQAADVRLCVVERDGKGYGLTVHGTKPVIVQSVRAEGAAWKAGIREHDEILEVNGVSVGDKTHADVVKLIKENNIVKFKVTAGGSIVRHRNGSTSHSHHKKGGRSQQTTRQITTTSTTVLQVVSEPRPMDMPPEKFREISQLSGDTARRMLGQAQHTRQELQQQVDAQPDRADLRKRLEKVQQQVDVLLRVVDDSGPQPSVRASVTVSEGSAQSPPPVSSPVSVVSVASSAAPSIVSVDTTAAATVADTCATASTTCTVSTWSSLSSSSVLSTSLSQSPTSTVFAPRPWVAVAQAAPTTLHHLYPARASVPAPAAAAHTEAPPLLIQPASEETELPLTHSKSCSMPEQSPASVRPPARSKSDSQEKSRPRSMDVGALVSSSSSTSTSSSNHAKQYKAVSQPHGIDVAEEDTSTATTPDPTPADVDALGHRRTNSFEIFGTTDSASAPKPVEPVRRMPVMPLSIDDPDMNDDEEDASAMAEEVRLFSNFDQVLQHPACCSKLIAYAYMNSKAGKGDTNFYRMLFILVMRDYNSCLEHREKNDFIKDLRRIVYEIYSTFVADSAPLNIQVSESVRNSIRERMQADDEEGNRVNVLKFLLKPAYEETRKECTIFDEYKRNLRTGLDNVMAMSDDRLRENMKRDEQLRYFESSLSSMLSEVPRMQESTRRSALLSAISTLFKHFQNADEKTPYRSYENVVLMSAAPFNSKLSKSRSSVLPNFRRQRTSHNGHSLTVKSVESEEYCEHCGNIICGAAPQAEVCHHCSCFLHRECRPSFKKQCDRSKRSSFLGPFTRGSDRKSKDLSGNWTTGSGGGLRQSQSLHGLHRPTSKVTLSPGFSTDSNDTAVTDRDRQRKSGSREGSAEQATSPGAHGEQRNVNKMVEEFNNRSSGTVQEEDVTSRESSEPTLGRSESMKAPSSSRPTVNSWRNKSFTDICEGQRNSFDCSQHGEAISEAESLQPGSSSDSIGQSTTSSISGQSILTEPEVKEADVRNRLENEPYTRGLPADVEDYMQDFGYRSYYDTLSREGSRKGSRDLKDYQIACCEMFFQELSHIRNLKIMQYMYVDQWPQVADDLKYAMGLDKLQMIIDLREELIKLLEARLDSRETKKFINMGSAYVEWLNESRSVHLKCLLGAIRYKGENHFDKLLQERYKRISYLIERTYNKLSLFDLMISVNQHACRPSLHLNTVKKALTKLQKIDKGDNPYTRELEVWKEAEKKLNDVAEYLNILKKKVVDMIPKIDTSKLHNPVASRRVGQFLRDVPRSLNSYYFLYDAKCSVKVTSDGKSKEARLLLFEPFLLFLYNDANMPDRYIMRQWEGIPAVVPLSLVRHVTVDRTSKKDGGIMLLLDAEEEQSASATTGQNKRSGGSVMVYLALTDDKVSTKIIKIILNAVRNTPGDLRQARMGLGSSMSLSHAPRADRSGSTVSTQSAMPILQSCQLAAAAADAHGDLSGPEIGEEEEEEEGERTEARRQDSAETSVTMREQSVDSTSEAPLELSKANERLLDAVRLYRRSLLAHQRMTSVQFEEMVDVVETEGAKDPNDLLLILLKQFGLFTDLLSELAVRSPRALDEEQLSRWRDFAAGLDDRLRGYSQHQDEHREQSGANSVFDEGLCESKNISVFHSIPQDALNEEESDEERKAEEEEDEEEKSQQATEEEEMEDDEDHGPVSTQDDEETTKEQTSDEEDNVTDAMKEEELMEEKVGKIARSLVQQAFQVAMQRVVNENCSETNRIADDMVEIREEEEEEEEKEDSSVSV